MRTNQELMKYREEINEIDLELCDQIDALLSGDESIRDEVEESLAAIDEVDEENERNP